MYELISEQKNVPIFETFQIDKISWFQDGKRFTRVNNIQEAFNLKHSKNIEEDWKQLIQKQIRENMLLPEDISS